MKDLNFGVLTRSTRDLVIVIPENRAIQILKEAGVVPYGVHFSRDYDFLINLGHRLEAFGDSKWTPGGSLSNTILASASCETLEKQKTKFYWLGISEFSDFAGTVNPIDTLRYMYIKPFCVYEPRYSRFTICVISEETKNVICIMIYSGDEIIEPDKDWPQMDILMTTIRELALAGTSLYQYICSTTAIALVVADHDSLDGATMLRLKELSQLNKLRWVFGHPDEFAQLGFVSKGVVISEFEDIEFIGTQEANSVVVWNPEIKEYEVYNVAPAEVSGNSLGAGDAYAGGYLYSRSLGGTTKEAHDNGVLCAKKVLLSNYSQIQPELNLNKIFGAYIDRSSKSEIEGELFNRIRLTPGLVITSCGQTGIDQLGLRVGGYLGLPAFGVLPKGRRTENSEGVSNKIDDFSDAFVIELGSESYRYCTWVNAFISDGTLLWDFVESEGSTETRKACTKLGRPLLEINNIPSENLIDVFIDWINKHNIRVINIAGNRDRLLTPEQRQNAFLQIDLLLRCAAWHRVQLQTHRESRNIPAASYLEPNKEKTSIRVGVPNSKYERLIVERFLYDRWGIEREHPRKLYLNYPTEGLEFVFARARDLPVLLQEGAVDIVFCGDDLLAESGVDAQICVNTGLQPCYIALIGKKGDITSDNLRIGSQYPNLSARLLREYGLSGWSLRPLLGSAEAWINSDIINGAIDTWRTGYTATINDLTLLRVFNSTCLVVAISDSSNGKKRERCLGFSKMFESWLFEPSSALIKFSL